jgi:hypothetical protein
MGRRRRDGAANQNRDHCDSRRSARTGKFGGGGLNDPRDNELLSAYPFGGGDLHGPGAANSMTTPLAVVQTAADDFLFIAPLDNKVRPKRFYFQPGEKFYRVEAIYEHDGWRNDRRITVPRWRLGYTKTFDGAIQSHMNFIEDAFKLPAWETRADVPPWLRRVGLVTTLHGMHYTGYMFNDYARMGEILKWTAGQIPAERVLVFLSSWDGRYYWDYPNYKVPERMGGEAGFRKLIKEGQQLGFKMMPMFGANAANRRQAVWPKIADAATRKIDGDVYNLNWVDWNNDRHQDGWLTYMNLGVDSWRNWLEARISDVIQRFGVDAYFLDIIGGHVNDAGADMHEGTRRLVMNLRAKHPNVVCIGEMPYDALHAFIRCITRAVERAGKNTRASFNISAVPLRVVAAAACTKRASAASILRRFHSVPTLSRRFRLLTTRLQSIAT